MGVYANEVQKLYIAYFNRPADAPGLAFWEEQVTRNDGSTAAIANAFSVSQEYRNLYVGKSNTEIVDAIYLNLFGRHAEPGGLEFWFARLSDGTLNIGNIAMSIMFGAQNADRLIMENKTAAAVHFTLNLDTSEKINAYSGSAAIAAAKAWLATITDKSDSLVATMTSLGTTISTISAIYEVPVASGQTFTLTTGADKFTGTANGDLFLAGAGTTLNAGDILDGGAGVDVLSVSATGQSLVGVTMTGIEEIRLVNGGTLNARADGLGTIAFGHAATTDTGDVTLAIDLSSSTSFSLSGVTAGQAGTSASGIKATYTNLGASALNVTLTGLAENFTGTGNADIINAGAGNDTIDGGAGVDTIDGGAGDDRIAFATAAADTVNGGAGMDTLVITGGAVTVDLTATAGAITNFEVVDATAATGSFVANVTTNPATTTAFTVAGSSLADNITTGAGNDVITMGVVGQTIAYDTILAAGGTDTLILAGNVTTGTIGQNRIDLSLAGDQVTVINNASEAVVQSGFENLDMAWVTPGTGVGFTITAFSGGSTIAGTSLADAITGGAGNDIIVGFSGADTVAGGAGTADTLVLINGGTTGSFTATNVQANAVTITNDGNLATVENITVSGSTSMTLTLTGQTEAFVISASTATAAETIVAGSGNDTISGSSLADSITGGLGTDSMTGGTGADTFMFNANGSVAGISMDVITDFAANSDMLKFSTTAVLLSTDTTALVAGANVQQSAGGLVTFATADNTLALKVAAVQADIQLDAVNSLAFFVDSGNTYVYFAGNATGNADDMIIQLTGVTTLATITAGATSTIA
jgi:Ca2+-binding RTX toxin-like protein